MTVHGFFEIPYPKHQRSIKSQIPNRFKAIIFLFGILNFGHCNLFVFWNLLFGISTNSITPVNGYKKNIPLNNILLQIPAAYVIHHNTCAPG